MSSKKLMTLLLLGTGVFVFNGFTTLGAANIPTVVESVSHEKLTELVTVNENAPVIIKYGEEHPINEILKVINQQVKEEHEVLKFTGISEVHKLKYVAKNTEVLIDGYNAKDFNLKEVVVEVRTKKPLTDAYDVKNYRVLVRIVDTNAPVITLEKESIEITEGDTFDPNANVTSVVDAEDGTLSNFTISGDYDAAKAGSYTLKVSVADNAGNKAEKEFTLKVKAKPVVVSRTSGVSGTYSYNISGAVFTAPDPSHMAALNGGAPGNCTWYVYNRLDQLGAPIPYSRMGNAGEWPYYAQSYGYSVSKTARVGTVVSTGESYYGHVAFVEAVNADGSIVVSEMNYGGLYRLSTRTISAGQAANATYIDFGLGR